MMWKYVLLMSYIGTRYCGWQKQKRAPGPGKFSIQETIESALQQMTSEEKVSVVGSGRTDSGVHAVGQVAHFVLTSKEWDPEILKKGLNSLLPMSIRILQVSRIPIEFHAQRSAERKQYSYYFQQGPCPLPHLEPLSWWIRKQLDLNAMNQALSYLVGEYDFKPFQASGAKPGPTVRKVLEAQVTLQSVGFPGGVAEQASLVRLRIIGTGFLKQMVRGIAGTLLQVGEGHRDPQCVQEILQTLDRSRVGATAPGRALWLEKVWYPASITGDFGAEWLT